MSYRLALVAAAVVVAVFSLARPALAQELQPLRASLTVDRGTYGEESSIDCESTAATVLYVSGALLLTASPFLLIAGGLNSIGSAFGGSGLADPMALVGLGATALILGVLGIGTAVGLDIDSASRRNGLRQRREHKHAHDAWLVVTPFGLAGTF
jgi:hypothetical protein